MLRPQGSRSTRREEWPGVIPRSPAARAHQPDAAAGPGAGRPGRGDHLLLGRRLRRAHRTGRCAVPPVPERLPGRHQEPARADGPALLAAHAHDRRGARRRALRLPRRTTGLSPLRRGRAVGRCVAELLGVPVVTSVATFAINRHVLAFGVSRGLRPKSLRLLLSKFRHMARALALRRTIRRAHGIGGPGLMDLLFGHSDLTIVYTSRQFQPRAETRRAVPVRRPVHRPEGRGSAIPLEGLRHPVVVYVSLGTLFNTRRGSTGLFRGGWRARIARSSSRPAPTGAGVTRPATSQLHRAALRPAAGRPAPPRRS